MPALVANAIGINPRMMPRDAELARLFEGKRADNGEAWSVHKRKLSGFDFVFAPHKSVSLAAEFAADASRECDLLECGRSSCGPCHALCRSVTWLCAEGAGVEKTAQRPGEWDGLASATTPHGRR